jgi:hypothetical protein
MKHLIYQRITAQMTQLAQLEQGFVRENDRHRARRLINKEIQL